VRAASTQLRVQGDAAIGLMSGSGATCFLLHAPGRAVDWPAMVSGERLVETRTAGAIVAPVPIV
jgi:4-diphosphocytidyl-2C-methyl-D-erythritol kinase